jgi:ribosomal protein S18 acetylase RimI-like enzyme
MIDLRPISSSVFVQFRQQAIHDYAHEKSIADGLDIGVAENQARDEFDRLLPDGKDTPLHHLFTLWPLQASQSVGVIWMQEKQRGKQRIAHILDLLIDPPYRRQGFALASIQALEHHAASLGLERMTLHVFGHNLAAQSLYAKLGFQVTDVSMAKSI